MPSTRGKRAKGSKKTDRPNSSKDTKCSNDTKCSKDPNVSKKPMTAFLRYQCERRESLCKEDPTLSFGDISKRLGREWKELTEEKKDVYKKQYREEKYEIEKTNKMESHNESSCEYKKKILEVTLKVENLNGKIIGLESNIESLIKDISLIKDKLNKAERVKELLEEKKQEPYKGVKQYIIDWFKNSRLY